MNHKKYLHAALIPVLFLGFFAASSCSFAKLDKRLLSDNPKTRERAIQRLKGLSPEDRQQMIAPMIEALKSTDGRLANRAEEALIVIGEPAVEAVSGQVTAADPFVRIISTNILGEINALPGTVVPTLVTLLEDKHPLVREEAAHALGRFGPRGTPAIGALRKAVSDETPEVGEAAKEALVQIGAPDLPIPSPVLPAKKPSKHVKTS